MCERPECSFAPDPLLLLLVPILLSYHYCYIAIRKARQGEGKGKDRALIAFFLLFPPAAFFAAKNQRPELADRVCGPGRRHRNVDRSSARALLSSLCLPFPKPPLCVVSSNLALMSNTSQVHEHNSPDTSTLDRSSADDVTAESESCGRG